MKQQKRYTHGKLCNFSALYIICVRVLTAVIIKYFIQQIHKSLHDVSKVSQLKMNNNIYFFSPCFLIILLTVCSFSLPRRRSLGFVTHSCPMNICRNERFNSFPIVCKYQLELMFRLVKNQSTQLSQSVDNPNTTYKFSRVWYLTKRYCPRQEILCFHYHVIKNKYSNHSIQKVQNLENERR